MSEAWEWVVAASKASVEALSERVAKLEVGRAELHDRCDVLSDAIGSLEQDALRPTREEASGQPASAGEARQACRPFCRFGVCPTPAECKSDEEQAVRDEPSAEQPFENIGGFGRAEQPRRDITTFVPDGRPHRESQNGSCYCDACCVKAGLAPAEQPSRQETPGSEAAWACRPLCGQVRTGDHSQCAAHMRMRESDSGPTCFCTQACRDRAYRDRAKAKAAERDDDEDDGMCCHFNEVREAPRSCTKDRGHDGPHYYGPRPTTPAESSGAGQVPNAPAAGTLSLAEQLRQYNTDEEREALIDKVAALETRLAQAELFLAVKDKVVAGFEERCKEADKKLAQAERDKASATQSLVDEYDRRKKAERERDAAAEEGRKRHLAAVLRAEEAELERDEWHYKSDELNDKLAHAEELVEKAHARESELAARARDATARERARCLRACDGKVKCYRCEGAGSIVTGRGTVACGICRGARGLPPQPRDITDRIRSGEPAPGSKVQCDPDPPREVAPDRTQQGGGR